MRIHSNGYWFRSLVQVSIPKFWCWRLHISETIWTTETTFAPFGSATIALGHSENRTRISLTVSEIFDRKNSPKRDVSLLAVRIHSHGCCFYNVVQVSIRKSWCWRLYISGTITTTETSFAPVGSVTVDLGHSGNGTRISLTVSEILDAKDSNLSRYFFILIIILIMPCELVRRHIPICWVNFRQNGKSWNSWCWRLQYLRNDNNNRDVGCTVW